MVSLFYKTSFALFTFICCIIFDTAFIPAFCSTNLKPFTATALGQPMLIFEFTKHYVKAIYNEYGINEFEAILYVIIYLFTIIV